MNDVTHKSGRDDFDPGVYVLSVLYATVRKNDNCIAIISTLNNSGVTVSDFHIH